MRRRRRAERREAVSPRGRLAALALYRYGAGAWCATDSALVGVEAATQQLGVVDPGA